MTCNHYYYLSMQPKMLNDAKFNGFLTYQFTVFWLDIKLYNK